MQVQYGQQEREASAAGARGNSGPAGGSKHGKASDSRHGKQAVAARWWRLQAEQLSSARCSQPRGLTTAPCLTPAAACASWTARTAPPYRAYVTHGENQAQPQPQFGSPPATSSGQGAPDSPTGPTVASIAAPRFPRRPSSFDKLISVSKNSSPFFY